MLSLPKNTGFIEFKWCETEFQLGYDNLIPFVPIYHSTKTLNLADCDYDLRGAPPSKNIDAVGILSTQNNMELIVVESSSGRLKEHTSHTIEDSLKILECGVAALKKRGYSLQERIIGYIQEAEGLLSSNNKDAGNIVRTVFV